MRKNREEAERWLKQAEYDLGVAQINFDQDIYSYACFIAEQTAQKALKAFIVFNGERFVWEHSVQKLADRCSEYDSAFKRFKEYGAVFDKFYLTTRYPDALAPPAVPYESYTRVEAAQAIRFAEEIVAAVKGKLAR